jgi:hypothetical protein
LSSKLAKFMNSNTKLVPCASSDVMKNLNLTGHVTMWRFVVVILTYYRADLTMPFQKPEPSRLLLSIEGEVLNMFA